eukprot:gene26808-33448_t
MIKKSTEDIPTDCSEKAPFSLVLAALSGPWASMSAMQESLEESPHSKAKAKYTNTVALLTNHEVLRRFHGDMTAMLSAVVSRVLFVLPMPREIVAAPQKRSIAYAATAQQPSPTQDVLKVKYVTQKRKRSAKYLEGEESAQLMKSPAPSPIAPPLNLFLHNPAALVDMEESMRYPGADCALDDFFFDEHCCEQFLSATLPQVSPASTESGSTDSDSNSGDDGQLHSMSLFDHQYHSGEDLDLLDFCLLSGVLSVPCTPRDWLAYTAAATVLMGTPRQHMVAVPMKPKALSSECALLIPTLLRGLTLETSSD